MFYTSSDSSTIFRFIASSSFWDWHNCYIVSPGQGQEIFIISANPTANTLRIFSRGNNMFPEKTYHFPAIPIHWWKLIFAIMQLFLMVVKGMFGSMGKWALDEDSWKQLQIPAQKLTSKPSPHIANLVISRFRVISVQQQMLKPQNLAQTSGLVWFSCGRQIHA